jgi:6,7-dimethyl-8-ribityllumazine synthase
MSSNSPAKTLLQRNLTIFNLAGREAANYPTHMSKTLPPKPRNLSQKTTITIVASQYNSEFTDALVENAQEELSELSANAHIDLIRVPGAFEIPSIVETVMRSEKTDCVIALGLIIRGQTSHGDLVANSVTQALQKIAVDHATPIIHEVLIVDDEKQAYARCIGTKLNRGREAASAAIAVTDTFQQFKKSSSRVFPSNV